MQIARTNLGSFIMSYPVTIDWWLCIRQNIINSIKIFDKVLQQLSSFDIYSKIIKYIHLVYPWNSTPLWKSNRNFFSTQFFYHLFFVVCSSFYTWYMWGGQYQLCKFLLDFDHWLCLSDILKKVTGSKPDVALVWFRQWAKLELEHGEKDRYWCIVRV